MKRQLLMVDPAGSSGSSCRAQIGERCAGAALPWAQGALSSGQWAQSTAWRSSQVSCWLPASPPGDPLLWPLAVLWCQEGAACLGRGCRGWVWVVLVGGVLVLMDEMGCVGGLGILAVLEWHHSR